MDRKFANGDVVVLKSGGPNMAVMRGLSSLALDGAFALGPRYKCQWFDDKNKQQTEIFKESVLNCVLRLKTEDTKEQEPVKVHLRPGEPDVDWKQTALARGDAIERAAAEFSIAAQKPAEKIETLEKELADAVVIGDVAVVGYFTGHLAFLDFIEDIHTMLQGDLSYDKVAAVKDKIGDLLRTTRTSKT